MLLLPPLLLAAALFSLQPSQLPLTPLDVHCPSVQSARYIGRQGWGYINSGGTGVVYGSPDSSAVLKVARTGSENRVAHECEMINYVNSKISGDVKYKDLKFVKCLDQCSVNSADKGILMTPLIPPSFVSTFDSLHDDIARKAVDNTLRILDLLLSSGVVLTDLQLLIGPETGDVYLIDLTESALENRSPSLPGVQLVLRHESRDLAVIRTDWPASRFNLVSEVVSQVPQRLQEYMLTRMRDGFAENPTIKAYVDEVF